MSVGVKPKALVFCSPFEGSRGYLLAGLSHYYQLDIYYFKTKRFRYKWQVFYPWAYDSDAKFIEHSTLAELLNAPSGYDAAFIHPNAVTPFFGWYENQEEMIEFNLQVKAKAKKIYWLDSGEGQYHVSSSERFWDNIDLMLKGQVFKKEYEQLFFNPSAAVFFNGKDAIANPSLVAENLKFDFNKYRHKILPCPYVPSITRPKDLDFSKSKKIYDIVASNRSSGNGTLRYAFLRQIQKSLDPKYIYSFDYDDKGRQTNLPLSQHNSPYLIPKLGKLLFKLKYGKYFYPQPLYVEHLARSKSFLALSWALLSFRFADCWGAGTAVLNFSCEMFDYGLPLADGYNYISVGDRMELSTDNEHLKMESVGQAAEKVNSFLGDNKKRQEVVKNGRATFEQYYFSPKQFVKKIFIDKL